VRRLRALAVSVLVLLLGLAGSLLLMGPSTAAEEPDGDQVLLVEPNGRWHIRVPGGTDYIFWYGMAGDVPLLGDWNGDGWDTPGMYRPANGFVYLTNAIPPNGGVGFGDPALTFFFGMAGDQVFVGDWNNDGIDTLGINRVGRIFLSNTNATTFANQDFWFGTPTDTPFGGNPDGIAGDSVFLYRLSTGFVYYNIFNPTGSGSVSSTTGEFFFGIPNDLLVIGDWDGDGTDTAGIFRPLERSVYLRNTLNTGPADEAYVWGESPWLPVAGRINLPPPITYELRIVGPLGLDSFPGWVTSEEPGIECANSLSAWDCNEEYPAGTEVTLTARMQSQYQVRFVEWIGGDCGSANPCTFSVNADLSLTPVWEWSPPVYNLNAIPTEGGTITSDPIGITNCSTSDSNGCTFDFTTGSWVTLTPTPDIGYRFSGWSDDACSVFTGPCTVLMVEDRVVSPTFEPAPTLPMRVNAGGPALAALDGGPIWMGDRQSSPSTFVNFQAGDPENLTVEWDRPMIGDSVPATTPGAVFASERYDNPGGANMHWDLPVDAGRDVLVRLYFANGYEGASQSGDRLFDVIIDDVLVLNDYDIVADVGHQVGTMKSFRVTTDTDGLDILFTHLNPPAQNPLVNAIEITEPTLNSVSFIGDAAVVMEYGSVYDVHSSTHGFFYTDIILDDLTQWIEPDQYNFVLLYTLQEVPGGIHAGQRGIPTPAKNVGLFNGSYGLDPSYPDWPNLFSAPHMNSVDYPLIGNIRPSIAVHEMGHHWGVFWSRGQSPGPFIWLPGDPLAWLTVDVTPHWSAVRWYEDGEWNVSLPGILRSGSLGGHAFNAFDLYAMGLMGYEEVATYTYNISEYYPSNNRYPIHVDDLIHSLSLRGNQFHEGDGKRVPDTDPAVEDLRTLIVVVEGVGDVIVGSQWDSITRLARDLPRHWSEATWGRSSMTVAIDRVP